jgi:NAD(P)-dependent dehydrogenase (short-subunit alcohol dehydrogenase family)
MHAFQGRTAVVTGAASGIGRALALHCAKEGMAVAVADVDEPGLEQTRRSIESSGGRVLAVRTDVSRGEQVEALAQAAEQAFGHIHLVFNNAGVLVSGVCWERSVRDWEWVLGVNLWGLIHGARAFVPRLLAHGEPAHVVNTASIGGLMAGPYLGLYIVSKHAAVSLTETLYHELAARSAKVGVSVLCPGAVATGIFDAERNRPAALRSDAPAIEGAEAGFHQTMREQIAASADPARTAAITFDAIREGRFWILPEAEPMHALIRARLEAALAGKNPPG